MAVPQNRIALVFDYDQTLSPRYMQDDVVFPEFGIDPEQFWKKCNSLVKDEQWDGEMAYLKCLLDYLEMDGVTNKRLEELGAGLNFFPGVPEIFDELHQGVLKQDHEAAGITLEYYIISSGLKALLDGMPGPYRDAVFLNASATLIVAGKTQDWHEGAAIAAEALDSGKAKQLLVDWIAMAI